MNHQVFLLGQIKLCSSEVAVKHRPKVSNWGLMLTKIGGDLRTCAYDIESTTEFLEEDSTYRCTVCVNIESDDFESEICKLPASFEIVTGESVIAVGGLTEVKAVEGVTF